MFLIKKGSEEGIKKMLGFFVTTGVSVKS